MENIDVIERKRHSYINLKDLKKLRLSKIKESNVKINKRQFN